MIHLIDCSLQEHLIKQWNQINLTLLRNILPSFQTQKKTYYLAFKQKRNLSNLLSSFPRKTVKRTISSSKKKLSGKSIIIVIILSSFRTHRQFRPQQGVFSKPHLWWKYAFRWAYKKIKCVSCNDCFSRFRCIKIHFLEPYRWQSIKKHREKYRWANRKLFKSVNQ